MGFFQDVWKAHPVNRIFGSNPDAPQFQGVDALAPEAFGTDIARENMGRYGFQGAYQNFLKSETERMKDDEQRRVMKLASNLVPGMASLRGGVASQGLGGETSNVLAKQHYDQSLTKALDYGTSASEASNARLDQNYFGATMQNEGMRFGASQDLMKSLGLHANALLGVREFNATGEMKQRNLDYESELDTKDQWRQMFGSVVGTAAGGGGGMGRRRMGNSSTLNYGDPNNSYGYDPERGY